MFVIHDQLLFSSVVPTLDDVYYRLLWVSYLPVTTMESIDNLALAYNVLVGNWAPRGGNNRLCCT